MDLKKSSIIAVTLTFLFAAGCSKQQSDEEKRVAGENEYNLGIKYLAGIGDTPRDKEKAFDHLEKAYKLGDERAAIMLAINNINNEKKRGQSLSMLKEAADRGNDDAMRLYGFMSYYNQDGTQNKSRFEESNKYMLMSIEKGNNQALIEYPAFLYNSDHKDMIISFFTRNQNRYSENDFLVKAMQDWVSSIENNDPDFARRLRHEVGFLSKKIEGKNPELEKKPEEGKKS